MAESKLKLKLHIPFYVIWYIKSVLLFCKIFGTEPDYRKIAEFIGKHLRVKR